MIKILLGALIGAPIGYITCCLMVIAKEGEHEETAQIKENETGR